MIEIFNSIPTRILIYLFNSDKVNFEFKITKEIDCNYSSCSKNINLLKDLGLINSKHQGQMNIISLTSRERNIAEKLNRIETLLR